MQRSSLTPWLALACVLLLALGTAATSSASQSKDEAGDWQAVTQALSAFQQNRSDENLQALDEAVSTYLANHPQGSNRLNAVSMHLQIRRIKEDWKAIIEFVERDVDAKGAADRARLEAAED